MLKWMGRVLGGLALVLIVAGVGFLGYRAWRQHDNARMLQITSAHGIQESRFVKIGSQEQWIQIRGEDRDNPVVLFLHGGPGYTAIPFNYPTMRSWERDFVMVDWDQRGAGRTYIHNKGDRGPDHTIAGMARDGIAMAEYLRKTLRKDKIILVGHSWGSVLGTEMIRQRPDLFYAYVGTGQVVEMRKNEAASYWGLMKRVKAAGDSAAEGQLVKIGAPPYKSNEQMARERDVLERFPSKGEENWRSTEFGNLLYAPGYSLIDSLRMTNAQDLGGTLMNELMKYDINRGGLTFQVPVFYFQGADDLMTPTPLVEEMFPKVQAPHKELVLIPGGHSAVNVSSERFREEMVKRVRPFAIAGEAAAHRASAPAANP